MTYNTRSPAVKRLMKEAQELSKPTELFFAKPLEDNLFEWHFTIRGPCDTDYDGGIYHGRILLPAEYPMKPPNILLMTPSGRFEVNRKICLSISGYHPETWRPSWSIRTALLAIIGFMPTHGIGAIGSLEYPPEERRKLAKSSVDFICPQCGGVKDILMSLTEASVVDAEEAKNLAAQISFTGAKEGEEKTVKVQSDKGGDDQPIVEVVTTESSVLPTAQGYLSWPMVPSLVGQSQPLSFEDWCRHMRPRTDEATKGDDARLSDPSSTHATAGSGGTEQSAPFADNSAATDELPTVAAPEIRQRAAESSPASPPMSREATLATLQQRQTMLLQCMAVVATILGLFVAVRLSSLGTADI